jgi:regulator of replication initiation timing
MAWRIMDIELKPDHKYLLTNIQLFADGVDTSEVFNDDSENDTGAADGIEVDIDESEAEEPIKADKKADVETTDEETVDPGQSHKENNAFKKMRVENEQLRKQAADQAAKDNQANQKVTDADRLAKEQELRDAGYDPEMIRQAREIDPAYQKTIQDNKDLRAFIQKQAADQVTVSDFNTLHTEYPDLVKTADDISDAVWTLESKGYSLKDAFYSANRDKIMDIERNKAKQNIRNTYDSKSQIKSESNSSDDSINDVQMDKETLRNYMDAGLTKKEAYKFHKKLYG